MATLIANLFGELLRNPLARFLGNINAVLYGNLNRNLFWDILASLLGYISADSLGNFRYNVNTVLLGNLEAIWNCNLLRNLNGKLCADCQYLFSHLVAVVFVEGLVILDADPLPSCGTLLVRNIFVDLLALLVVDGGADVLALGLVVRIVGRGALLGVDGGAGIPVDVVGDNITLGAVRSYRVDRSVPMWSSRHAKSRCQEKKADQKLENIIINKS